VDPEATTTKSFYRITQPVAEVSSIAPAVISTTGGELVIDGQGIPAGSSLVLEFDGQSLLVPLVPAGGGLWDASVIGQFLEDSSVIATGIVDGTGTPVVSLNEPIAVTATGRALDAPPSLPPGAPVVQDAVSPVKGVGVVIKKNPGGSAERISGGKRPRPSLFAHNIMQRSAGGGAGKATFKDFTFMKSSGGGAGKATFKDFTFMKASGGGAGKATFKEFTVTKRTDSAMRMDHSDKFMPQGIDASSSSAVIAAWASKKGYDYYRNMSDFSSSGAQANPYFTNNESQGEMVPMSCSLPGEVHIPVSALSLACPAGPNIDWVCTYRSMVPVSSSHGPGWDFSYNISIEPLPAGAGTTATRVAVRDGQGRRDIYHRQPDGSYRCPGMFREGRFDGDTFTLTFADKGTWVFAPLSHRSVPKMIILMTDRNGVSLTCDYDVTGKLATVSSQFGQSLSVSYAGDRISSITDHTGRSVSFNYYGSSDPGGSEGDLHSISCPQEPGQPPAAGPVTFTYSTGSPDRKSVV
jgi:hypothetical protein